MEKIQVGAVALYDDYPQDHLHPPFDSDIPCHFVFVISKQSRLHVEMFYGFLLDLHLDYA